MAALAVALGIVAAGIIGYELYATSPAPRGSLDVAPHVVAVLANGSAMLEVPLMTLYTISAPQHTDVQTNMSFRVSSTYGGPSTAFHMRWSNISGAEEPIRFNLVTSGIPSQGTTFHSNGWDEFQAQPAGDANETGSGQGWSLGMAGSDIQQVYYERWVMNYTILQVAQTQASVESRWVQVNYSLAYWGSVGDDFPAGNVSAPTSADLMPIGGRGTFNLSRGSTISALLSTNDPSISSMTFRHAMPPIVLRAGGLGNLAATLSSEFTWDSSAGYWVGWTITAQRAVILYEQGFLDKRFGSLLVQISPGP